MGVIEKAIEFESRKHTYKSTNEKIVASREAKTLVLRVGRSVVETKIVPKSFEEEQKTTSKKT